MRRRLLTKAMTRFLATTVLLVGCLAPLFGQTREQEGVHLRWGVAIPMRDGVKLNATIYRPADQTGPLPVIFTFTPYISDTYHPRAMYFARHGYVFALVDVRGRGNSEGVFEPFVNEGRDGYDVVEWLARQPWSSGKVTMWGGSYAGFDQWTVIKEAPAHLVTIVPVASAYAGVDFPFERNIFSSYVIQWLTYTSGVTPQANLFGESAFWTDRFRQRYLKGLPFRLLDSVVGNTSTVFQKWLQHPTPGPYWDAMNPSVEQYRKMTQPILTITGHYDGDQPGAMEHYRMHLRHAPPEGRAQHYLIVGPWDHAGTRTPSRDVGGLRFGEASLLDMNQLHQEWYDWTMKDGAKPAFLKKRVAYYVVPTDEWKYADSLEAIADSTLRFYLTSTGGRANDAFASGGLSTTPTWSGPDAYTYDPLDLRPAELEQESVGAYLTDQRAALNLFGNGLVYHSSPFEHETEVTGYVKLAAWMAMNVPDTDFEVTLYEILRDGTSIALTQDRMRARYRESPRQEKLVEPGQINRYEFNRFTFFSRRVAAGSRLRLLLRSPNSIHLEKNYNSGGVVAEESAKNARTARITLYHDAQHPSLLELPVVKSGVVATGAERNR